MSKEKIIEEIARDFNNGMCSDREVVESCAECVGASEHCLLYKIATRIYNAGYSKQSEGEWVSNCQSDEYICSLCGGISPVDCEKENFYKSNYCPNCGAKMKGGAE